MDNIREFLEKLQSLSDEYNIYISITNYDMLSLVDKNNKFISEIYTHPRTGKYEYEYEEDI